MRRRSSPPRLARESRPDLNTDELVAKRANAERVKLFLYRVPEELYDYENDPDALNNLIGDPAHKERVADFRRQLAEHMKSTSDPQLAPFTKFIGN